MTERLARFARRVEDDPFFLGAALAAYARSESLDDAALARALGCDPAALPLLRLCRCPRPEPATFRDDVDRIAVRFGADAAALAQIVRRADALAVWRAAPAASGREDAGLLAAARDRDEEPPDDAPEGER